MSISGHSPPGTRFSYGATGSMFWADPETGLLCVLVVNRALESGWSREVPRQALFSNAAAVSVME